LLLSFGKFLFKLKLYVKKLIYHTCIKLFEVLVRNVVDSINLIRIIWINLILGVVLLFLGILLILFCDCSLRSSFELYRIALLR
jgi:hypothetical protein